MLAFLVAAAIVAIVIIVAARMAKKDTIHIPRETRSGDGNEAGEAIRENKCPKCGDTGGFFTGPQQQIYCGNARCRAGYRVMNFGDRGVLAEEVEPGPGSLYQDGGRFRRQSR